MNLATPESVRKLQRALYAKAKADPAYCFYTLYDKIYRKDVLQEAWSRCRANDGSSGVDGQSFEGIERKGVERWLEELAPLQEVCQEQVAPNEGVSSEKASDALQEVLLMQPAVVVGLISMMTGNSLQEDIVATARVLIRKGQDILESNPGSETTRFKDENQTCSLSATGAASAASV